MFISLQAPDFSLFIIHTVQDALGILLHLVLITLLVWSFRNVAAGNLAVTGFWQNNIPNQQSMRCDGFLPAHMSFHTLRYVLARM